MFNVTPKTAAQLKAMTSPAAVQGGNMEAYAFQLFDTAPLATGDTIVRFFAANRANAQATNLDQPGALTDPKYLEIHRLMVELLVPTSDDLATADPFAQVDEFVRQSLSTVELNIQNKNYGPWTLTAAAGGNGPTGFGFAEAATAGTADGIYASAGAPGTWGFPIQGSITLKPKIGFDATIRFGVPLTAALDGINARVSLIGTLYRAIV